MRRATAAALLAAVLLAACGGGSEAPEVVSKELYIAQSDEVCAGLSDRFQTAGRSNPRTAQDIVESAQVLSDLYDDLIEGLKDVGLPTRPGPDRREASRYVSEVARTNARLAGLRSSSASLRAAVAAKDKRAIESTGIDVRSALDAFRAEQAKANQTAIRYGFRRCGNIN